MFSSKDLDKAFEELFYSLGRPSTSGVPVSSESAMRFSAVFACVRIISEDIGMLPTEIKQRRKNSGGFSTATDHPVYHLLKFSPNPETNSMTFCETLQSHILLSGNGYAFKEWDSKGRLDKLTLLDWHKVGVQRNLETNNLEYTFDDRGKKEIWDKSRVFHVSGFSPDGILGYSPIRLAMDAIGLGMAAEQFASYFYANGANVGGFIKLPASVKDKAGMIKEFEEKFTKLGKSHKVIFLEDGMDFQKLVMPLREAQFIEIRKFQIEEIARIYRTPLHMLQDLTHATFSNIEHQDIAYVKRTLLPWIRRWEIAVDTQLLTSIDRKLGHFCKFDIDEMLRGDSKSRAEVNHLRRQNGVITANEWRLMDNLNPSDDPMADRLLANGNMVPINALSNS